MTNYQNEDYDEELDSIDTKAILLGIHAELQALRVHMAGQDGAEGTTDTSMTCHTCGESYAAESVLRAHAEAVHKAPPDISLADLRES